MTKVDNRMPGALFKFLWLSSKRSLNNVVEKEGSVAPIVLFDDRTMSTIESWDIIASLETILKKP